MSTIISAQELVARLLDVAENYKTLYVLGGWGAPLNADNKKRYCNNNNINRFDAIKAASEDTFAFDCICLWKALAWGWRGDLKDKNGGAVYCSNGVPDIGADSTMNEYCTHVSTDFSNVLPGEAVWLSGHIGYYIGDGLAVECTPIWKNGVQITACNRDVPGYNRRNWTKHGRLPWVDYGDVLPHAKEFEELTESDTPMYLPTVKQGDKGPEVSIIQALCAYYNCNPGDIDGDAGPKTRQAIIALQRKLGVEADGEAGPQTLAAAIPGLMVIRKEA